MGEFCERGNGGVIKTDLSKTVIINQEFEEGVSKNWKIGFLSPIQLIENTPNRLRYTYQCTASTMVVFSEIYYKGNKDWKAYIDGEYAPHIRANYVLRAMELPKVSMSLSLGSSHRLIILVKK